MPQEAVKPNILGTEKISRLLFKFAVPGIIAMVVNSLYNIIDQIFIGWGVGYLGNGATTIIFPLTTIALAFAMLLGDGAAAYFSLMLGAKREQEAARAVAAGLSSLTVVGIIIAVLYNLTLPTLCRAFGASDAILPYAIDYGRIIAIGVPFATVCAGGSSSIRADGSPKFSMIGLLLGCAINTVLDPIFIFIFKMGVSGAALATILGQIANAVLVFYYASRKMKSVKLDRSVLKTCLPALPKVMKLGVSSFITQLALVAAMAARNNMLLTYGAASKYGSEIPVTTLGITMKCFAIMMAVIIGLATGAQPIFGYNYGARQYSRVKKTFVYVAILSTIVCTMAFAVAHLWPRQVIGIFGAGDELYFEFATKCMQIYLMLIPLAGVQIMSGIFFQALGYPLQSSILSLSKQVIFQIPFTLLLPRFLGVEGVLWAGPVSDIIALALTIGMLAFYWPVMFRETKAEENAEPLEDILVEAEKKDGPLIITIGRSYGSGGRSVGRAVAERLGIPFYDTELLAAVAAKTGINENLLEAAGEHGAEPLILYTASDTQGMSGSAERGTFRAAAEQAQQEVIESVAAQGSCVIVGRRADQILKGSCNVLSVFITRPLEARIASVCSREHLSAEESRRKVLRVDRERTDYYNSLSDGKWGTAGSYDLCMDIQSIGTDSAASLILRFAEYR